MLFLSKTLNVLISFTLLTQCFICLEPSYHRDLPRVWTQVRRNNAHYHRFIPGQWKFATGYNGKRHLCAAEVCMSTNLLRVRECLGIIHIYSSFFIHLETL